MKIERTYYLIVLLLLGLSSNSVFSQAPWSLQMQLVEMEGQLLKDTLGILPPGAAVYAGKDHVKLQFHRNKKVAIKKGLYVTVLDLQPDGLINVIIPERGRSEDYKLGAQTGTWSLYDKIVTFYPPYGKESFVTIFSEIPLTFYEHTNRASGTIPSINFLDKEVVESILSGNPPEHLKDIIYVDRYDFEIRIPGSDNIGGAPTDSFLVKDGTHRGDGNSIVDRHELTNDLIYTSFPVMTFFNPPESGPYNQRGGKKVSSSKVKHKSYVVKGTLACRQEMDRVEILVKQGSSGQSKSYVTRKFNRAPQSLYFEQQIELDEGVNLVEVRAFTREGNACSHSFKLNSEPQEIVDNGEDYLLVMAINEYEHWAPLNNPINDAKAVVKVLTENYGFEKKNVITMFDQACTRYSVDSLFRYGLSALDENDRLLVYFAGHGTYDDFADEGYWIPIEAQKNRHDLYISNSTISNYMKALKTRHTLFVSDACFSGNLCVKTRGEQLDHTERLGQLRSRWIFSSGRSEEVADAYGNTGHSPFAWYLTKYLESPPSATFTISELAADVTKSVGNNSGQLPIARPIQNAGDEGGEFVFEFQE